MKVFIGRYNNYSFVADIIADNWEQVLANNNIMSLLHRDKKYSFTAFYHGHGEKEDRAIRVPIPKGALDCDMIFITEQSPEIHGEAVFSAIAGAVAAAVAAAGASAAVAAVVGAVVAAVVVIGISLLLGQVMQMLSPSKKAKNADSIDSAITQKNMLFNGVQNIVEQGGCVPYIFGECLVGGVVISKRISVSELLSTIPVNSTLLGTPESTWQKLA